MESFSNQPSKPSFTQKTLNDWQPDFLIAWLVFTIFSVNAMFTEMRIYVWETKKKILFLSCFCFSFVLCWWTATAGWGKEVYIEVCYQDTAAPIRLRSHPPTPDLDRNAHVTTGISVPLLSRTRLFLLLLLDCSVIHSLSYSCSSSSFTFRSLSSSTPPPLSPAAAQLSRLSPGVSFKHGTCAKGKYHAETITRVHLLCKIAPNTSF